MVTTSGFAGTPTTRFTILTLVSFSLLTSILDIKHLAPIKPTPHLWPYLQFSRVLTFQLAYISSTEVFFAAVLLYQCRVLERLWGARRFGSFVVLSWLVTAPLTVAAGVVLKVLTLGWWGYVPPGLTALVVCLVVVWREEVPRLYGFKVVSGGIGSATTTNTQTTSPGEEQEDHNGNGDDRRRRSSNGSDADGRPRPSTATTTTTSRTNANLPSVGSGIVLSDKFTVYLMAAQLTLSQFPYQLLPALVGWVVGVAWREELLPTSMTRWRVPAWVVGETGSLKGRSGGSRSGGVGHQYYEGLRRRLEEEGGGARDGMREVSDRVVAAGERPQSQSQSQSQSQRAGGGGLGQRMMGYFTNSS